MHVSTGKDLAAKMLSLAADSYKDEIQRWLLRREGEAKITAANPLFREALTRIVSGQPGAGRDREILTAFLHEMLLNFPHYEEIYFVDRGGRIFLSTDARRVGQMRPRDELVRRPLEDGGFTFKMPTCPTPRGSRVSPSPSPWKVGVKGRTGSPTGGWVFLFSA
jgi:hypothetical protein